jgi:hypothetical protein
MPRDVTHVSPLKRRAHEKGKRQIVREVYGEIEFHVAEADVQTRHPNNLQLIGGGIEARFSLRKNPYTVRNVLSINDASRRTGIHPSIY